MTDLTTTQFLFESHFTHCTIKAFKRKRQTALLDKAGKVLRLMSIDEFLAFKREHGPAIQKDGLRLATIWTLIPTSESTKS